MHFCSIFVPRSSQGSVIPKDEEEEWKERRKKRRRRRTRGRRKEGQGKDVAIRRRRVSTNDIRHYATTNDNIDKQLHSTVYVQRLSTFPRSPSLHRGAPNTGTFPTAFIRSPSPIHSFSRSGSPLLPIPPPRLFPSLIPHLLPSHLSISSLISRHLISLHLISYIIASHLICSLIFPPFLPPHDHLTAYGI